MAWPNKVNLFLEPYPRKYMIELNASELEFVSGGGKLSEAVKIVTTYLAEKAMDAAVSGVSNLNQGGTPSGTDAMGNNW